MIRPTDITINLMRVMVNARSNSYWATRSILSEECKKVKKSYLDVLLKRLLKEGLIERQKIFLDPRKKRSAWGYRATEEGLEWWMDPSKRGCPPRYTQHNISVYPLGEIIEKDGWVERWNLEPIRLDASIGRQIEDYGGFSAPSKKDPAQQRIYDSLPFKAILSKGKRSGYKIRFKFRLEPWRDHLAEWLITCGFPDDAISSILSEIEEQLPGSYKQQEHPIRGAFRGALKRLDGRIKIESRLIGFGPDVKVVTQIEHSRDIDLQCSGDAQLVDSICGGLISYQNERVIESAREKVKMKQLEDRLERLEKKEKNSNHSEGDVCYYI